MSARSMLLCLVLLFHFLYATSSTIGHISTTQPITTQCPHDVTTDSQSAPRKIKCPLAPDPEYGGKLMDCSNLNIVNVYQIVIPNLHNTTTLLLDYNNISCLHNMAFSKMDTLKKLSIRDSHINEIQVNALYGLKDLEVLDLEYNNLSLSTLQSFPHGMFDHVLNVRHLFIGFNMRDSDKGTYENIDIFSSLPGLQTLSIDAFTTLHLNKTSFNNLTKLVNLTVTCTLTTHLTNNSLIGIQNSTLRTLSLVGFEKPVPQFEYGLFENLPELNSLKIVNCPVGNKNMMKTMYPFENRTMSLVHIERSNYVSLYGTPNYTVADGIIDKETMKSLLTVCLEKFVWSNSNIFAFKPSTFLYAYTWHSCLKYFDLSNNRLEIFGWRISSFEFLSFIHLKEFTLSGRRSPSYETHPVLINFTLSEDINVNSNQDKLKSIDTAQLWAIKRPESINQIHSLDKRNDELQNIHKESRKDQPTQESIHNIRYREGKSPVIKDSTVLDAKSDGQLLYESSNIPDLEDVNRQYPQEDSSSHLQSLNDAVSDLKSPANFSLYFPRSIEVIRLVEIWIGVNVMLKVNYICSNFGNLRELYWINNDVTEGSSKFFGFSNLQRLDLSMNMFLVSLDIFDSLNGLKVFVAKAMRPDAFFDNTPLESMLHFMPNLRYLDVSSNKLNIFPPGTFSSVRNLTHLILSKNRFTSIAFDLALTPNLQYLDLSANAILFLDEHDTQALDQHLTRNVPHLTLDLRNNSIACGCGQLPFLVWLYKTEVNILDKEKLMCTYDDGRLIPVFSIDIMHYWRKCQGGIMLMGSVILFAAMAMAFLIACLIHKFRLSLEAYVLRLFSDWFRPMKPSDYKIHTFIGYADDDVWFVRNVLRVYLEDELGVTTYIHQRDLRAGSMDQQFLTAITNSWRTVLVLSDNFLQRYLMSHLMMKYASHSVSAMNQGRVFVLVEESQLHNIPDYLDCVLDDSKVIVLSDLNSPLDYQQRQRIKDCLRP